MNAESLFLNGVYQHVLEGILVAQRSAAREEVFYLQPYKSVAIAKLRDKPPGVHKPTVLYASTTDNLPTVSYCARVVGWKDKTILSKSKWAQIDGKIRQWDYDNGLYDYDPPRPGKRMVNLLCIQQVVKLESPFSVACLIKVSDGKPLSTNRTRSGGWSYVVKKE